MSTTTENKTPPNQELVTALKNSPEVFDWRSHLEARMTLFARNVQNDTFVLRAPNYSRQNFTVALLLAGDATLRDLAQQNHVDLRAFDNVIGQVQQLILVNANKPAPAAKVANALRRLCGL